MNVKKLKQSVEILKSDLDGALLACDIWPTGTAQSIAGYNPQPKATALFEKVTDFLKKSLHGAEFPSINDYYMLDMVDNATIIVMQLENDFQWGMLVDKSKVQLGFLLNIALPNARKAFAEALES
jgi:hypothetical protein